MVPNSIAYMVTGGFPVDETLTVLRGEDVYRTGQWWKSVVQYHFGDQRDSLETAIYLWHNDDDTGWTRKNKYVVKTLEAWEEDQEIIEALQEASTDPKADERFPVSDYYTTAAGKTVFKTDTWWKAIVRIEQKGDYETEEYNIYVWQFHDEKWRRRQKYAIKSFDDWQEERSIVSRLLNENVTSDPPHSETGSGGEPVVPAGGKKTFGLTEAKATNHLSQDLQDGW